MSWTSTLQSASEVKAAIEKGILRESDVLTLQQILKNKEVTKGKHYTVFRSTGTPMQNVATLKAILDQVEK